MKINIDGMEFTKEDVAALRDKIDALLQQAEKAAEQIEPLVDRFGRYLTAPAKDTTYYCKHVSLETNLATWWTDTAAEHLRLKAGACFVDEASADAERKRWEAEQRLRLWKEQNAPFTPDWGDQTQCKVFMIWDHGDDKIDLLSWVNNQIQPLSPEFLVFATRKDAKRCIAECEDDIRLLFTGK